MHKQNAVFVKYVNVPTGCISSRNTSCRVDDDNDNNNNYITIHADDRHGEANDRIFVPVSAYAHVRETRAYV
jgi:hypothetical protein